MKVFFATLSIAFLMGCSSASQEFDARLKINDKSFRTEIIKALKTNGVPHKTHLDGSISFFEKDEKRIKEIQMIVSRKIKTRKIHYPDRGLERRFLQVLDAEKVPYDIVENYRGMRFVLYSENDSEKVERARKKAHSWDYDMGTRDEENYQRILKALNEERIPYEIVELERGRLLTWMEKDNESVRRILWENPPLSHLKAKRISGLSRQDCLARDDVVAYLQESGECLVDQAK